jgi:hypothetical protein
MFCTLTGLVQILETEQPVSGESDYAVLARSFSLLVPRKAQGEVIHQGIEG